MAQKKPVHKKAAAEESAEVKGLRITLDSLIKSGFKKDSKEVKAIEKLIEQHK
jgi:hypothetical protein